MYEARKAVAAMKVNAAGRLVAAGKTDAVRRAVEVILVVAPGRWFQFSLLTSREIPAFGRVS